jgi:hypothetical protein
MDHVHVFARPRPGAVLDPRLLSVGLHPISGVPVLFASGGARAGPGGADIVATRRATGRSGGIRAGPGWHAEEAHELEFE